MSAENIAVVRRLIDEVWNQRAFDVLDELFTADAIISESGVPFPIRGPQYSGDRLSRLAESDDVSRVGGDYFERRNVDKQRKRLIRQLESLGVKVTVEEIKEAA